jgi:hypothetical protein
MIETLQDSADTPVLYIIKQPDIQRLQRTNILSTAIVVGFCI